jgi:hypothetical protein
MPTFTYLMISVNRQQGIRLAIDRIALGISHSSGLIRSILEMVLGTSDIPDGYVDILKDMETPSQKSCGPLVDKLVDLLKISRIESTSWATDIQEAIDSWLDFTFAYLRLSALRLRHHVDHYDPTVRRSRLAAIARVMRYSTDIDTKLKALAVFRKFRYQRILDAIPEFGSSELHTDPTVSLNYTSHRRVGKPLLATLTYATAPPIDDHIRGHVADYNKLKALKKINEEELGRWLAARGLSSVPRVFAYSHQIVNLDAFVKMHDSGLLPVYHHISTGLFRDREIIHPLATYWKLPIGRREKKSWHRWWKWS